MSASWVTFLFEAANFLLLAALLGWIFFRPVREALERRRAGLEAEERAAAEKQAQADQRLAEATARRLELESSLDALRARVRQDAEREAARLIETAREEAQRARETLKSETVAFRRDQARTLAHDAAAAAREIAVRLLERIRGPELEQALFEAARRELKELAAAGPLAPLLVEAPALLGSEVLARLADAAGVAEGDLKERAAPELVAGLRVLTARGLVDASAAGLAAYAERALAAELEAEGSEDG
ncbi:MAG TPA: hypothetical protein VMW35_14020 [Myxococcota bacterium]|nr:hypothetical protein [Myxococcota bacterium]